MLELALSSPPTPHSTAALIAAVTSENNGGENKSDSNELAREWDGWRRQVKNACALLVNATRDEKGPVAFVGLSFQEEPGALLREECHFYYGGNKGGGKGLE